jgi:peptide/nickel transport system permease protein
MDRSLAFLLAGRVAVFIVAFFMILTALFMAFFVANSGWELLGKGASTTTIEQYVDEFKLDEHPVAQYINFITRMMTGDFYNSASILPGIPVSDFIYDDLLITLTRVAVVTASAICAGLAYAYLSAKHNGRTSAIAVRAVALAVAVVPGIIWFILFRLAFSRASALRGVDSLSIEMLVLSAVSVMATMVLVMGGIVRQMRESNGDSFRTRILNAMSEPRFSAVIHFFLAYVMISVIIAETAARIDGIGDTLMRSVYDYDYPILIACVFLISTAMLSAFLAHDLVVIRVSAQYTLRKEYGGVARGRRVGIDSYVNNKSIARVWSAYSKSRIGMAALVAFVILLAISLLAPALSSVDNPRAWYGSVDSPVLVSPSLSPHPVTGDTYLLGTDHLGRDVYSLLLYDSLNCILCVVLLGFLSLTLGIVSSVMRDRVDFLSGVAARSTSWTAWMLSDVLLAFGLLFASLTLARVNISDAFLTLIVAAWIWAPSGRADAIRTLLARGGGEADGRGSCASMLRRILHISKFCVLLGFLSIVMITIVYSRMAPFDVGWAVMVGDALRDGAFLSGEWWTVLPPAIMIGLLASVSYVILDRLEWVFERWHEPTSGNP